MTSSALGRGPCMLLVNDSTIASSRLVCQPCQVQGLVWVTRRRVGTFLRLRRWNGAQVLPAVVERVEVEAVGVAVAVAGVATVPLVERVRSRRGTGSRRGVASDSVLGPPRGIVWTSLADSASTTWIGVGEVIGDVERLAVGGEGQLGRPAAQRRRGGTGRLS